MKQIFFFLSLLIACLPMRLLAEVGTPIPIEMIPKTVVQGHSITTWEKDKLYIFECWATWCGPCRSAMKHVEELWQTVKVDGHVVIGLNVMDRLSEEEIKTFLEKLPTKVTYTNLLVRDEALTKLLNIQGIPFTFVVRNGIVVWQGHPMRLNATMLRALDKGETVETPSPKPVLEKPKQTIPPYVVLERKADEALAFDRWEEAEALQLKAMQAHPLQARLTKLYTPSQWILEDEAPESTLTFQGVDIEHLSADGDLAPYAKLLGKPLPKLDGEFTIVSYWQPNFRLSRYTSRNTLRLPRMKEAQRILYPYRLEVVGDAAHKTFAERQFASVPMIKPSIVFLEDIDKVGLFGYTDQNNPPFVAIFLSGKLIYKGALELLPETLLLYGKQPGPMPTADVWLQRIADERTHEEDLRQRFLAFRKETDTTKAEAMIHSICADAQLGKWEMILMPYRLGSYYNTNDVEGATKLVNRLYQHYYNSEYALEMLNKLINNWPPLKERVLETHSLIAERLAQIQTQGDESYTVAYYELAGVLAQENNNPERAQAMWTKALELSATGKRYREIRQRRKPVPSP